MKTDPKVTAAKIVERLEQCRNENDKLTAERERLKGELKQKEDENRELKEAVEILEHFYRKGYIHGTNYDFKKRIEDLLEKYKTNLSA